MQAAADRFGHHGDHPAQGDQLHELPGIAHHGAVTVASRCARPVGHGLAGQIGEADAGQPGQPVVLRQHHHLPFGDQLLGIQARQVVLRAVQQADVGTSGPLRPADGSRHRFQCGTALAQQDFARGRQPDATAGPLDQGDAHAALKLQDRPRQRGLGDAEPSGGPAEVKLLGDRDEVAQLPCLSWFHTLTVSVKTQLVLACRPVPVIR